MKLTQFFSALCLVSLVNTVTATDPKSTTALSANLEVSADGLNRFTLPAQALQESRFKDLRDIRVVNGSGQTLPLARIDSAQTVGEINRRTVPLVLYPVYATHSTGSTVISGDTKFRFEESNGRKVVQIDLGADKPTAKTANDQKTVVGVILDLRTVKDSIEKLTLGITLPLGRPISIQVRASKDLQQWRTIRSNASLYRFAANNAAELPIEESSIDLAGVSIQEDYIQLDWSAESADKSSSIEVKGVSAIVSSRSQKTTAPYQVPVTVTNLAKAGAYQINLPYAPHVQSLTVRPSQTNTLVPFVVSIEKASQKPNSDAITIPVGRSVAFRLKKEQDEMLNPPMPIAFDQANVQLTIQGENSVVSFTTAPQISAQIMPIDLAFVASAPGPFKVEVQRLGSDNRGTELLPIKTLIPGYQLGDENKLSVAKVNSESVVATPTAAATTEAKSAMPPTKTLILWAVLLAGVILLAFLAFSLSKQKE